VNYGKERITFSAYFAEHLAKEEFEQIVLHELAHVLAGPETQHGALWKQEARAIGYTGGQHVDPIPGASQGGNGFAAAGAIFIGVTYAYPPIGIVLLTLWAAGGLVYLWRDLKPVKQFE
jgi:hypothetical protein